MNRITLTGAQIAELAEFAGIRVLAELDSFEADAEFTIQDGPVAVKNDDNSDTFFTHFAYCEECPEEGGIGLGEPIEPPKSMVA